MVGDGLIRRPGAGDAERFQARVLVVVDVEEAGEHLAAVLAEHRRRAVDTAGRAAQPPGCDRLRMLARFRMRDARQRAS